MIVMRLPDIELARAYPTAGPQGFHLVDVNGQAAGIELYLGRAALSVKGELRSVRRTGYNQSARAIKARLNPRLTSKAHSSNEVETFGNAPDARTAFPELASVWEAIFAAVQRSAEAAERKRHGRVREI
jgi:hypothetical protein